MVRAFAVVASVVLKFAQTFKNCKFGWVKLGHISSKLPKFFPGTVSGSRVVVVDDYDASFQTQPQKGVRVRRILLSVCLDWIGDSCHLCESSNEHCGLNNSHAKWCQKHTRHSIASYSGTPIIPASWDQALKNLWIIQSLNDQGYSLTYAFMHG